MDGKADFDACPSAVPTAGGHRDAGYAWEEAAQCAQEKTGNDGIRKRCHHGHSRKAWLCLYFKVLQNRLGFLNRFL